MLTSVIYTTRNSERFLEPLIRGWLTLGRLQEFFPFHIPTFPHKQRQKLLFFVLLVVKPIPHKLSQFLVDAAWPFPT